MKNIELEGFSREEAFAALGKFAGKKVTDGVIPWMIKGRETSGTGFENFAILYRYKVIGGEMNNLGVFSVHGARGDSVQEIYGQLLKLEPPTNHEPKIPDIDKIRPSSKVFLSATRVIYAILAMSSSKIVKDDELAVLYAIEELKPADVVLEMQKILKRESPKMN
jgi:hypothetical protein